MRTGAVNEHDARAIAAHVVLEIGSRNSEGPQAANFTSAKAVLPALPRVQDQRRISVASATPILHSSRVRRWLVWLSVVVVWVVAVGVIRASTAVPSTPCDDLGGDVQVPLLCLEPGPSWFPALPVATAIAAIVAAGGYLWLRQRSHLS